MTGDNELRCKRSGLSGESIHWKSHWGNSSLPEHGGLEIGIVLRGKNRKTFRSSSPKRRCCTTIASLRQSGNRWDLAIVHAPALQRQQEGTRCKTANSLLGPEVWEQGLDFRQEDVDESFGKGVCVSVWVCVLSKNINLPSALSHFILEYSEAGFPNLGNSWWQQLLYVSWQRWAGKHWIMMSTSQSNTPENGPSHIFGWPEQWLATAPVTSCLEGSAASPSVSGRPEEEQGEREGRSPTKENTGEIRPDTRIAQCRYLWIWDGGTDRKQQTESFLCLLGSSGGIFRVQGLQASSGNLSVHRRHRNSWWGRFVSGRHQQRQERKTNLECSLMASKCPFR